MAKRYVEINGKQYNYMTNRSVEINGKQYNYMTNRSVGINGTTTKMIWPIDLLK
jgi:guanylate kinase